jgi:hypothetical protein
MSKVTFKVAAKHCEDPNAPRRAPHVVLNVFGGGSPYGSTTYKRSRLCPFEDALVTIAKLRPQRNKEALDVGWIVHQAWEAYYAHIKTHQDALGVPPEREDKSAWEHYFYGAEPEAEKAGLAVLAEFENEPGYLSTSETAARTFQGYCENWRRRDTWRILAVEETLVIERPIARAFELTDQDGDRVRYDTWRYSARLDLVIERWDTKIPSLWVVEHKTAKMISEDLLHGYQLDMQILGQVWLMQNCVDLSTYAPYKGVIVNIATKHKTPRFERLEVAPSNDHLLEFEHSTIQWGLMRELFRAAGHPRALGACSGALRGYSKCAYYELCHSRPTWTIDDWVRETPIDGFYRDDRLYQEEGDYDDYV